MAARPPVGIRLIFAATLLLGLGTAIFWAWSLRIDPSRLSQDYFHEVGTTSKFVTMQPLPTVHHVVIRPLHQRDIVPLVASQLPAPVGRGPMQVQGYYDTGTRTIHVTGRIVRLSASVPLPQLRGLFVRALRHEYGHAFLDDWLRSMPGNTTQVAELVEPSNLQSTRGLPEELAPVVEEYTRQPAEIYGSAYPTSNFNEFFAESYARFLGGERVPPEMERFLAAHSDQNRRTSR